MRKITLLLLLVCTLNATAQKLTRLDYDKNFMCSYYGEPLKLDIETYDAGPDAETTINTILSMLGLKSNFKVRAALVPNAAAVIYNNKRYILYNPKFFERMQKFTQTDWSSVSILAHEVGHHLNGHTLEATGSRPEIELEADEFSGFVLRKMGSTLYEAQAAMNIAAAQKGSHTHPPKASRLRAIAEGWNTADAQMNSTPTAKKSDKNIQKPSTGAKPEVKEKSILAKEFIAYEAHFYADKSTYYITVRGNLVKIADNQIYIVGRLTNSNKKGYNYMLYDKHFNYLYVSASGDIRNGSGKKVGFLKEQNV
jgi:hypothetical protein